MTERWRYGETSEGHFEPLLALRIDVMREHLERVSRFSPERAREVFRGAFDRPGLRLILVDDEIAGCVAFRPGETSIQIDSFYLARHLQGRGLGAAILQSLLDDADALGKPATLSVLRGSPADRFYRRHGFEPVSEDDIERTYERAPRPKP